MPPMALQNSIRDRESLADDPRFLKLHSDPRTMMPPSRRVVPPASLEVVGDRTPSRTIVAPWRVTVACDFFDDDALRMWTGPSPIHRLKRAEDFAAKAVPIAKRDVAIFARSVFAESIGRHECLFSKLPPTKVAQFVERVPIVKGRLDAKA